MPTDLDLPPPRRLTAGTASAAEQNLLDAISGMVARPDFLIPIVAAERQFRAHYYGLISAALLEDLFFDALGNYLRQTEPEARLVRPPTGQKGWDYSLNGLRVSHKVSQRVDVIAAIWDATIQDVSDWSFEYPIVYSVSGNSPQAQVTVNVEGTTVRCRSLADLRQPTVGGRTLLIVEWPAAGRQPRILDVVESGDDQSVREALSFSRIWRFVAEHVSAARPANEIDVLVTNSRIRGPALRAITSDPPLDADISVLYRAGVYLFPRSSLQGLPVTRNNRGVLIPKAVVQQLLVQSQESGLSVPLPLWYTAYARERPPDMYSAQRLEYDARFSARGELDA